MRRLGIVVLWCIYCTVGAICTLQAKARPLLFFDYFQEVSVGISIDDFLPVGVEFTYCLFNRGFTRAEEFLVGHEAVKAAFVLPYTYRVHYF